MLPRQLFPVNPVDWFVPSKRQRARFQFRNWRETLCMGFKLLRIIGVFCMLPTLVIGAISKNDLATLDSISVSQSLHSSPSVVHMNFMLEVFQTLQATTATVPKSSQDNVIIFQGSHGRMWILVGHGCQ